MGQGEKNLIIEEEISIGNGQASVEKLLRYDVTPIIQEFKVINNKVITKGNLKVYILYTSHENTRTHNFSVMLPFSQIVDIEGVNEDCKCNCNASVVFCELKQRSGDDECRSFTLTAKLSVEVNAFCENEIPLIYDAYSTCNKLNTTNCDISLCSIKENFSDKFIAKKTLEFSDGSIGSIIDMWCDCQKNAYKCEGKYLIITGSIIIHLLTFDIDGLPGYFERPIDFEYRFEPSEKYSSIDCKSTVNILNSSFTIMSANQLEFSVELSVLGSLFDTSNITVLSDVEVLLDKKEPSNNCGITIYFAQEGERLWDIAKRYNSCMEEIKNINNFSDDMLCQNKSLIIPNK